jgi:divalent metal cation (Fe/Co/Zn/Cd) transporter
MVWHSRLVGAESAALAVPGVDHVHVRARWLGRTLLVEVEGFLAGSIPLADIEATGRSVNDSILGALPEVRAVVWLPHALPIS